MHPNATSSPAPQHVPYHMLPPSLTSSSPSAATPTSASSSAAVSASSPNAVALSGVSEIFDACPNSAKKTTLAQLLEHALNQSSVPKKVAIFLNDKAAADSLTGNLRLAAWPSLMYDPDGSHSEREWIRGEFWSGKWPVVVLTDAVLHSPDVAHGILADNQLLLVINFDFPPTLESYRARAAVVRDGGVVYSFFSNENRRSLQVVSAIVGNVAGTMPSPSNAAAPYRGVFSSGPAGASAAESNGGAPVTWTNVQSFLNSTQPRPPHAVTPPLPTSLYSPPIGGSNSNNQTARPTAPALTSPSAVATITTTTSTVAAAPPKSPEPTAVTAAAPVAESKPATSTSAAVVAVEPTFTAVPEQTRMLYRKLGNSGLRVSALSFGTWTTFKEQLDDDAAFRMIELAMQSGCNTFDTAEIYGNGVCEARLGRCLARGKWKRSDFVVTTKLIKCGTGPNDQGLSRKHVFEGLAASLRRLQLDYVDVVYAHRMDEETNLREAVMALSGVVDKGLALYWGTSEWSVDALHSARAIVMQCHLHMPVVEQPQYNLFVRDKVERDYVSLTRDGLGLMTWSPLKYGVLSGKYVAPAPTPAPTTSGAASGGSGKNAAAAAAADGAVAVMSVKSGRTIDLKNSNVKVQLKAVTKLQQLIQVENLRCTVAQLAIAWCLANQSVSSVIVGASSLAQLSENLAAVDVYRELFGGADAARATALLGKIHAIVKTVTVSPDENDPQWSFFAQKLSALPTATTIKK
jgi:voltage-dependent potassium channel beta subunit